MESLLEVDLDVVCQLSQQDHYDFVVIGSGVGGGIVAQQLVKEKKKVLLLEKGGLLFSSHCLNTSRPHWQRGDTKGPSQDNDVIYSRVKARVETSEGSDPYTGGPVYCLGGRSTVWGLFSPTIDEKTLETYFPVDVKNDLEGKWYHEALKLFSWHAATKHKYPNVPGAQDSKEEKEEVKFKGSLLKKALKAANISRSTKVEVANIAAEFIALWWYNIPQGAYSTVDYLLDLLYAKNQFLTVLMNAEVLYLEMNEEHNHVKSIVFRDSSGRKRNIKARTAIVLSAGAIDSARIALNSDLHPKNQKSFVGVGLTDHEIWGVRLKTKNRLLKCPSKLDPTEGTKNFASNFDDERLSQRQEVAPASEQPLKLQCMVDIHGQPALLNVCINADTFLGRGAPILGGYSEDEEKLPLQNTLNITLQYKAELEDENRILNLPGHDAVIRIKRKDIFSGDSPKERKERMDWLKKMQSLVTHIKNELFEKPAAGEEDSEDLPAMKLADFGVVAHEVGTMRMSRGEHDLKGVVDKHLNFIGVDNLYVCDLSIFPVSPPANPTPTLAALALRLADYLSKGSEGGRGERGETSVSPRTVKTGTAKL